MAASTIPARSERGRPAPIPTPSRRPARMASVLPIRARSRWRRPATAPVTIDSIVVAEAAAPKDGIFQSNEALKITWAASSSAKITSAAMTIDGRTISPQGALRRPLLLLCDRGLVGRHAYLRYHGDELAGLQFQHFGNVHRRRGIDGRCGSGAAWLGRCAYQRRACSDRFRGAPAVGESVGQPGRNGDGRREHQDRRSSRRDIGRDRGQNDLDRRRRRRLRLVCRLNARRRFGVCRRAWSLCACRHKRQSRRRSRRSAYGRDARDGPRARLWPFRFLGFDVPKPAAGHETVSRRVSVEQNTRCSSRCSGSSSDPTIGQ